MVVQPEELEARVRAAAPQLKFTAEELRAVTGLLAGEGVLRALPYGELAVLQPSWVNCHAATLVKLAGQAGRWRFSSARRRRTPCRLNRNDAVGGPPPSRRLTAWAVREGNSRPRFWFTVRWAF